MSKRKRPYELGTQGEPATEVVLVADLSPPGVVPDLNQVWNTSEPHEFMGALEDGIQMLLVDSMVTDDVNGTDPRVGWVWLRVARLYAWGHSFLQWVVGCSPVERERKMILFSKDFVKQCLSPQRGIFGRMILRKLLNSKSSLL